MAGVGIQIGGALVPVLTSLVEKITPIITKMVAWAKENPKMTKGLAMASAAVGALLLVLGPLLIVLPGIISAFGLISSIIPIVGAVIAALTGPIGLIIAAVIALTVLIVKNWTFIKDTTKAVFDSIARVAVGAWRIISDGVSRYVGFIIGHVQAVIDWVSRAIEWFKKLAFWKSESTKDGGGGGQSKATGGIVKGYAAGGQTRNPMIKVGERGMEMAALPVGSRVLSHPDMMRAVSQGESSGGRRPEFAMKPVFNLTLNGIDNPTQLMDKLKAPLTNFLLTELKAAMR
jgi:hypothetical protein